MALLWLFSQISCVKMAGEKKSWRKRGKENVWPTAGVKLYPRGGNRPLIYSLTLWTDNPVLAMSCKDLYNTHAVVQKYKYTLYFLGWNSA